MTSQASAQRRFAIFLDRDGVLNVDIGYAHRPEDLRWIPGAREAVRAINAAGFLAIVVTNQSGVARGFYSEEDVHSFHAEMQSQLAQIGARVDAFYFCPYHPEGTVPAFAMDHPDRKPRPGMLVRAMADYNLDPTRTVMIGDQDRDIAAARAAGLQALRYAGGDLLSLVAPLLR